ncbi:hypothetical protein GA0115240_14867 [Streptomyces sp. DvalAA-14]|uniref:hypothetical protein n=1 Tax=unclassified Streptomyces TaxID=2593676 RepID=UPI00081B14AA|nr:MULTISPECIES: hypothetical protein [unclassified Streptomyces]MYS23175.1 hypothetical protein [Streptomyces sp. SID4948]SCE28785.1 hypothetical protein GA0115240_14867 [Streptomyces sp. DvalAA-14]
MISMDSAPRLRPDVFVVPSGRGTAYVRSSTGTDLIAAPGIAAWLDRLTPFLDGSRTVRQLLDGLDEARRATVVEVLERLDAHGLVEDLADPGPAVRAAAYARLRVLVVAPALAADAVAAALRLTGADPVAQVTDPIEAEASVDSGQYDALLLAAGDEPIRVSRLDAACRRNGMWFAAAVRDADAWWIGPMLAPGPDRPEGGWLGAWLRLHGTASGDGAAAFGPEGIEVAAPLLVHHFHRAFTAGAHTAADELIRLDPIALTSSLHHYRPHPAALTAAPESEAEFLAKIAALRAGAAVDPEELSRRAAARIDARTGLIAELDEGGLPQFPRRAATAVVRDPLTGGAEHRVHGVGPDFTAARLRTARRALEVYAQLAADPRRYTPTAAGPAVWAWSPEHGSAHLVPAAAVFGRGPRAPRGLGSGTTFDAAVRAARQDLRGASGSGARSRAPADTGAGTGAEASPEASAALLVPLDHDPAATWVLPYLLKAVNPDD